MKYVPFSILPLFLILFCLSSCVNNASTIKSLESLKQDEEIQVYFNHNLAKNAAYSDPYRNIKRPGDNLEDILIKGINSAQKSIDIAVQELRLPKITTALIEKHKKGIKVRIILENQYNKSYEELTDNKYGQISERTKTRYQELASLLDINNDHQISSNEINQRDAIVMLRNAQIPLIDDTEDGSKGSGLMHHKFVIIDNKIVVTGSPNFTTSDIHGDFSSLESRGNANNLLQINSPKIAQIFTEEFNLMWGDGPKNKKDSLFGNKKPFRESFTFQLKNSTITINFSPDQKDTFWSLTSNGLIDKTLNNATKYINLALFVFTDQNIVNTLETKHNLGVEIKALIDPSFAYRYYSEGLDMLGVSLSNKCNYEKDNKPWQKPIQTMGVPNLPQGDLLHHKFAIIDQKTVITGSHNWSDSANYLNDETLLIIENPLVATHFQREFDNLYHHAILGLPTSLQQKIDTDQQNCKGKLTLKSKKSQAKVINLNIANKKELENLPNIGPSLADRIIKARQEKPLTSLEDLDQRVSGVGPKLIEKLRGKVTF